MVTEFKPTETRAADSLHISFSKRQISGLLTIHTFNDNGHTVSFIPALNLSAYGDNKLESMQRLLNEVLDDFFGNIMQDPIAGQAELKKLGWKQGYFKKRFTSEMFVDREGVLRNFNLPEETLVETLTVEATAA